MTPEFSSPFSFFHFKIFGLDNQISSFSNKSTGFVFFFNGILYFALLIIFSQFPKQQVCVQNGLLELYVSYAVALNSFNLLPFVSIDCFLSYTRHPFTII